jgi:hypothetical protein
VYVEESLARFDTEILEIRQLIRALRYRKGASRELSCAGSSLPIFQANVPELVLSPVLTND